MSTTVTPDPGPIGITVDADCVTFAVHGVGLNPAGQVIPSVNDAPSQGQDNVKANGTFESSAPMATTVQFHQGYQWHVTYFDSPESRQGTHMTGWVDCPSEITSDSADIPRLDQFNGVGATCQEDDACWDCASMGNQVCASTTSTTYDIGTPPTLPGMLDIPLPATGGEIAGFAIAGAVAILCGLGARRAARRVRGDRF